MTAGADIPFACRCGTVTGILHDVRPQEGTHVVCHCNSCARAMRLSGLGDSAAGGVDLWQTTPDRIEIATGADRLIPVQLSPKGLFRWTAQCCDTPMINTFGSPALPFAGILTGNLSDPAPLGPVIAHGFVTGPNGKQRHQNGGRVIWRFVKRTVAAKLGRRGRQTPFFNADGSPINAPVLAPRAE
ncbi:DUF6151 family protein [Nioella sp. MMSF_3534]|uniref:DUF6151 family protein n=1 Tax=Nioella sp. MMSF_3534 TaxID=3046720 RepID=UPI00273DDBCA|nr:DUF6151 family protein [Nioella sp. MMSF_3534]